MAWQLDHLSTMIVAKWQLIILYLMSPNQGLLLQAEFSQDFDDRRPTLSLKARDTVHPTDPLRIWDWKLVIQTSQLSYSESEIEGS